MVQPESQKWCFCTEPLLASVLAMRVILAMAALLACHQPAKKADGGGGGGEDYAAPAREVLVGRRAPAVTVEMLDGDRVALAELVGRKPVYLKFWATWCKPCREQMPHLEAAHRKYGDRVAIFAVDLGLNDAVETVRAFRAEHKLEVPIAIDGDGRLAEQFHVSVTPQHVLIDRAGVVRYVGHGATPELDRALGALVEGGAASSEAPARAAPADDALSLALVDGSTFAIAGQLGRPVALTFVTTWCDGYLAKTRPAMSEACIAHARQVEALRKAHQRVVWVTIAHPVWTTPDDLDGYRKRLGVGTPIGRDDGAAWFARYRVRDVPTTIVLDARGAEVARVGGRGDELAQALARLP
jgi:thiol-disulfide isomerase/thioredoxin